MWREPIAGGSFNLGSKDFEHVGNRVQVFLNERVFRRLPLRPGAECKKHGTYISRRYRHAAARVGRLGPETAVRLSRTLGFPKGVLPVDPRDVVDRLKEVRNGRAPLHGLDFRGPFVLYARPHVRKEQESAGND
ncbi:MAG: hypothetical protein IH987_02640 [Planctomycetes bacterium]|nr:hypothetical protein [Planctomycetota bacterium]